MGGVAYAEAEFQQREVVRQALRYQSDAQTLLLGVPMDGVKVSDLFDETTNKINLNKPYTPKTCNNSDQLYFETANVLKDVVTNSYDRSLAVRVQADPALALELRLLAL